jgi:hypothetical protein
MRAMAFAQEQCGDEVGFTLNIAAHHPSLVHPPWTPHAPDDARQTSQMPL